MEFTCTSLSWHIKISWTNPKAKVFRSATYLANEIDVMRDSVFRNTHTHTHSQFLYDHVYNLFKDSLNYFVCSGGIRVMQKILEGVCKKYPRHCLGGGFIGDWGAASGKFSRPEGVPWPAGHRKHPRPVRGKQTGKSLELEIRSMWVLKSF